MGITLEKIELVKDRTGASYKEASEALEHAGGSVVDAIIEIEEQAKTEQNKRERVDKIDLEGEKKKLTFILDSIIEDPSIPLEKKVTLIVHTTSLICAVVAVQPIPFADIFVLSPIQLIMVTYLNKALGNPYEKSKMNEMLVSLLGVVGWGVLAQQLILGAYKAGLPYIAGVTTIPVVYAATWALGTGAKVIIEAKKNDIKVDDRELKKLVKRTKEEIKKEKKAVSISSIKRELLTLNNDAKEFEKYKVQLEDMQKKLIGLGIYDIEEKTKDEIILNTDISKVYQNRYNLIDKRIYSKYNNLAFSDQTKNLLALLPPRILLEEVEQVIGQINHDITRLNVYKPSESSNVREVITGFGNISLIIKGKIIYLQYIELNEEIKSGIILMDYIEAMNTSLNNRFLKDKEIREILVSTFETAKEEVNIISPWANAKVMDSLRDEIQSAVNRGVIIKILYGIGDFNSNNQKDGDIRNIRTEKVLKKYANDFGKTGCFKIRKGNTHIKLLICDNKYYVQGSFNYLSFDGSYKDNDLRSELALYSESSLEIQELRKAYFNF